MHEPELRLCAVDWYHQHLGVLSQLQTGIVVHGPDTQIAFCNPRAAELLGLSIDQMCGRTAMDAAWHFVDEAGRTIPVCDYPVNRVISSGQAIKGMVLGVNAGLHSKTVWVLVNAFAQHGPDGLLTQVVVDFHDISELKRAQELQLENEIYTTAVLDSLTEHIAVLDKDARIVAVNLAWRQFARHNGASPATHEPIGSNYLEAGSAIGHPMTQADGADAYAGIVAVLSGQQEIFQLEYPCHSPTEKRWFRMKVTPLKGERGGVVVSHVNITQQHLSELEARRNMQLLLGSIEAIDEAFVIYDAEERLIFCNEKYRALYPDIAQLLMPGTRFEDIIRAGAAIGFYLESTANIEEWVQERLAAFRSGDQTRIQRTFNGKVLRVIERKMPDGHTVGYRIDITDLVSATDAALAASQAKSRFLATMSHEIRTPMNGILGMAQMLLMPNLQDSQRNDYARTILSSGHTLLTLLNDILDLAKIEAGNLQLDTAAFDPKAMIHEICNLFEGAAHAKGLQLDCQWNGEPNQRFKADSHRLRQMLSNLVGNAIKFTPQGQIHIQAQELERSSEKVLIKFSVSDTGIGIAADKLDLLFKPFSQADSSTTREFGGSGLGLSIVSNLAKAMEGDVGVSSEPGAGSLFWFVVPVRIISEAQESRLSERQEQNATKADTNVLRGNVLVAEDNMVNCMVIETILNSLGVTVSMVHDGEQAVQAVKLAAQSSGTDRSFQPDLILMDLHMPALDGYGATTQIRQWEDDTKRQRLPIIALTADAYEVDRQHCLAAGMDDFLTKPVDIKALKAALSRLLPSSP